jgi:prefoldin subunit 5
MNLTAQLKKEIDRLDNQINKLAQELAEKNKQKKSLEKALKQITPEETVQVETAGVLVR